ncbi:MAG: hypothetical protein WD271_01635 [Acidimicrobiia bacterium]
MGLFDKVKGAKQQAADAMQQATAMQQTAGAQTGGLPGADTPGMGGQDMAKMAAYSQMVNKIATSGVEAPGVIHSIRAAGTPDFSGTTMTEFDVTIRPEGGEPYQTTIEQGMLPFQMEGISEGMAIVVKYDPDNTQAAIIHSW